MAFTHIQELFAGRHGSFKDGSEREWVRRFRVRTTSKMVGPIEVMFAPGIPRLYDSYFSFGSTEVDVLALCRSITPTQDEDDWQVWIVECEYSTASRASGQPPAGGGDPSQGGANPADNPEVEQPVVEYGSHIRQVAFSEDIDGEAVFNSAGQPFDPVPTIEDGWDTLTVERNELEYDRSDMADYAFKVNLGFFLGEAPGTVLCRPITARQAYKGGLKFWRVRYEFHFANEQMEFDWKLRLLDQGLCVLKKTQKAATTACPTGAPSSWSFTFEHFEAPYDHLNGQWVLNQTALGSDTWTGTHNGFAATLTFDVPSQRYYLTFNDFPLLAFFVEKANWHCNGANTMVPVTGWPNPGVIAGGNINPGPGANDTTSRVVPVISNGQVVGQPLPLDGAGNVLGAFDDPVWLEFTRYDFIDFDPLNIKI